MFKLELLDLLREYKNADEYEQKKILYSLSKLLKEHKEEAEVFLQSAGINEEQKQVLHQAYLIDESDEDGEETETEDSDKEKVEKSNDFAIVKSYYKKWLKAYKKNNNQSSQESEAIIQDMLTYYAESKPEVFFKLFEMSHDRDFEDFKNVLKNTLRAYYVKKIRNYRLSDSYKKLSFLKKMRMKSQIKEVYDQLGNYKFPVDKIRGVLNGN
jgi:hypothetical protein